MIIFVPGGHDVAVCRVSGDDTRPGVLVKIHLGAVGFALPVDGRGLAKPLSGDGSGSAFRPAVRKIVLCNAEARFSP